MQKRDQSLVPTALTAPAPLPSLPAAFSRRAALFGAVTTTGFLAAAGTSALGQGMCVTPIPSTLDPADAALVALINRHRLVEDEWQVLGERWDELHDRWLNERPDQPEALTARFGEGLGAYPIKGRLPDGSMGSIYGDREVEQIRATTPRPKWIGSNEPCPIAVARRAEILAAYDTWKAECDAVSDRIGIPDAKANSEALGGVLRTSR